MAKPCQGGMADDIVSDVREESDRILLNITTDACGSGCVVGGKYEERHVTDVCTHCLFKRAFGLPYLVTAGRIPTSPCNAYLIREPTLGEQGTADMQAEDRAAMTPAFRVPSMLLEPLP